MKFRSLVLAIALVSTTAAPAFSGPSSSSQEFRTGVARDCKRFSGVVAGQLISDQPNSPINIRDGASTKTFARHIGYAGDSVAVLDRTMGEGDYCWYQVRFVSSNATGWVRGDFFLPYLD